jgi:hypothetical protein
MRPPVALTAAKLIPRRERTPGPVFRNDPWRPGYFFAFLACRFSFSVF